MKAILLGLLVLAMSANTYAAAEQREYKKTSASSAIVTIKTEEQDNTQAAVYADGKENAQFIADLLKDPNSILAKTIKEIEKENCETTSTSDDTYIEGCGEVTVTPTVMTSFGRGGWMSGGASYTFFIGFTSDGSGHFFNATHMVTISEDAEAAVNDDFQYKGIVEKSLSLDRVLKIPEDSKN